MAQALPADEFGWPASWRSPCGAGSRPSIQKVAAQILYLERLLRECAVQHTDEEYGKRQGSGKHTGGPFRVAVSPTMRIEDLRKVIWVSSHLEQQGFVVNSTIVHLIAWAQPCHDPSEQACPRGQCPLDMPCSGLAGGGASSPSFICLLIAVCSPAYLMPGDLTGQWHMPVQCLLARPWLSGARTCSIIGKAFMVCENRQDSFHLSVARAVPKISKIYYW